MLLCCVLGSGSSWTLTFLVLPINEIECMNDINFLIDVSNRVLPRITGARLTWIAAMEMNEYSMLLNVSSFEFISRS